MLVMTQPPISRTVTIRDTEPPVITLKGFNLEVINQNQKLY